MHQNIYKLYSQKSPTCFDPAGPSSGRIVCPRDRVDSMRYLSNGGWNPGHIHT
jgi:hypothetical protein